MPLTGPAARFSARSACANSRQPRQTCTNDQDETLPVDHTASSTMVELSASSMRMLVSVLSNSESNTLFSGGGWGAAAGAVVRIGLSLEGGKTSERFARTQLIF